MSCNVLKCTDKDKKEWKKFGFRVNILYLCSTSHNNQIPFTYVQLSPLWQGRTGFALPAVQQSRNRSEDPLPMDKGLPHAHAGAGSHELPAPPPHLPQARSGSHRTAFGRAISSPILPQFCPSPQASNRFPSSSETLPIKLRNAFTSSLEMLHIKHGKPCPPPLKDIDNIIETTIKTLLFIHFIFFYCTITSTVHCIHIIIRSTD